MPPGNVVSDAILVLREWLDGSKFKPGARLPSERLLGRQLGLKHNAVNRAMGRLIAEGLVQREGYKLYYAGQATRVFTAFTCDLILGRRSIHLKSYRKLAKELEMDLRIHPYESVDTALGHMQALDVPSTECVLFDAPHGFSVSSWALGMERLLAHGVPAISIRQQAGKIPCVQADFTGALEMAFSHLRSLGHEDVALLTIAPRASVSIEIHDMWLSLARQKGGREMAKRMAFYDDDREDVRAFVKKLTGEWKSVTAVIVYSVYEAVAAHLVEELTRVKRRVPEDISVICLGDLPLLATVTPPISAVAFDFAAMHEIAFRLGQRLARRKHIAGLLPPFPCLRMDAHLLLRQSTAPTASFVPPKKHKVTEASTAISFGSPVVNPTELKQTFRELLKRPYGLVITTEASRFTAIDLTPYMNRSLHYRKGWLGDLPLPHLTEGRHLIHGVPFNVLGGPARTDRGAIVFHSATNETGSARGLPSRLKIPIGTHADAVYFLHGCGYTRYLANFATYTFYAGKKQLGSVPLIALGLPPHDSDAVQFQRDLQKANIQDWWPDFPHHDFTAARQAPIVAEQEDGVIQRYAYLYTLEWRNPFPKLKITHLEITSDPTQPTTLGLLAMSIVRKRDE
ncbi:substrate-binding domain-containing protein [Rariglobus hedericola]|uniref:GntR family transcriptional regulator n=1 Tax=Rariglobus hedericola TaxID=2597822 RepID=A0A556QL14_9BACT|nr:substrate-binding domain-containing protein [Rariglobus hedericola]TSJ77345.1 GntR family transcriptional regulator [Rariglobus hedericola]